MVLGRSSRYTSGVQDDLGLEELEPSKEVNYEKKVKFNHDGIQTIGSRPGMSEKELDKANEKSLNAKVLSRVFSEDFEREKKKIAKFVLDPRGKAIRLWSKILMVVCIVALFVDPIFLYLPITDLTNACVEIATGLQRVIMILRSVLDAFYFIQIIVRFHTAYVAPSSRVFGRGELVINHKKILVRYLQGEFSMDLLATIPIPQIMIWLVIPKIKGSVVLNTRNVLRLFVTPQYIVRLYLIFPLSKQIVKATGVMIKTASLGAAFNVMLFLLASHVLGGCWYIFGTERIEACWKSVCYGNLTCELEYFDCGIVGDAIREAWIIESNVTVLCNPSNSISNYPFGIYSTIASNTVPALNFWAKVSYCFWWGLQQLSLAAIGLILFSLIFGDLQRYVLSTSKRLEKWRLKRTDTELWMRHRQLPPELKESVQKFDRYKWVTTRGIDEEALLKALPSEIRRDIKRHLCLDLVRRVSN
ncbi:hypothetical protein RJ641_008494 [Dillenia turbinata]|uniref:Ion transport domain-containing protein n=1 Tax=Dillenia turbinata TaxID=194707 RepID=A0AAN8Z904_9MAGN